MATDLESKLKRALEVLEKASQDFKLKRVNFAENNQLEALKELIKEQTANEDSVYSARETR